MVAQVDLKTHSRWIREHDPNNSYRYPRWLYRLFWFQGAPNRVRPQEYVRALRRCGWTDIEITPLSQLGDRRIRSVDTAFRDPSDQMNVLSIVLCARKSHPSWLPTHDLAVAAVDDGSQVAQPSSRQ